MKYLHSSKAGNHGDVLKHVLFVALLRDLQRQESDGEEKEAHEQPEGVVVFDTHAGIGKYDLTLQKKKEHEGGLGRLLKSEWKKKAPSWVVDYVELLHAFNSSNEKEGDQEEIIIYPGSPTLAKQLLRKEDRLQLCELNPPVCEILQSVVGDDPRIQVQNVNGYDALLATDTKPFLVLIDPPYEDENDYDLTLDVVRETVQRNSRVTIVVWYPILGKSLDDKIPKELLQEHDKVTAVSIDHVKEKGLLGSGMVFINPTPAFAANVEETVTWLASVLGGNPSCQSK